MATATANRNCPQSSSGSLLTTTGSNKIFCDCCGRKVLASPLFLHRLRQSKHSRSIPTEFFSQTVPEILLRYLCAQGRRRFDGEEADLWNLSRPSDSRLRVWGIDIQTEIRSSRRQPTGQRSAQRQSRDHRAEPWFRGRSGIVAEKCGS